MACMREIFTNFVVTRYVSPCYPYCMQKSVTKVASTENRTIPFIRQSSPQPDEPKVDVLITDYLNNDNMESLCCLVFDIYAGDLKKIIVNKLHPQTEDELNDYLTDFCDFLLTPTKEGNRRLDNFQAGQSLIIYLKSILRNWATDILVARSQASARELSVDADNGPVITDIADDNASPFEDMTAALIKGIDGCDDLNPRDRYILLTWLMVKSADADATQLEVCATLAEQLECSPDSVRKALGRALVRLKHESMKNF